MVVNNPSSQRNTAPISVLDSPMNCNVGSSGSKQKAALSKQKIDSCRKFLEKKIAEPGARYYGINTGFGALCDVEIPNDQLEQLQENLVMSHACGMGDPLPDQPGDLRTAVAAEPLQVRPQHAPFRPFQPPVLKAPQYLADPFVAPCAILAALEFERLRSLYYLPHLLQRAHLGFVHVDHHPSDDQPPSPPTQIGLSPSPQFLSGSFLVGITCSPPGSFLVG